MSSIRLSILSNDSWLVGLSVDRMGITRNTYDIRVDDKLRPYI